LLQLSKRLRCRFGGKWLSLQQYPMWLKSILIQNDAIFNIYEYQDQLHIPIATPFEQQNIHFQQQEQYQLNNINDFDIDVNLYTVLHTKLTNLNSNSNTNQHISHNNILFSYDSLLLLSIILSSTFVIAALVTLGQYFKMKSGNPNAPNPPNIIFRCLENLPSSCKYSHKGKAIKSPIPTDKQQRPNL